MFPKGVVQLLSCKGGRDCQDGGWLSLRSHWHWDSQGYERDETVRALEAVRYAPEARYNLTSIRVLDEKDVGFKCNKISSQLAKETG